jgi:hypothetical protein
MGYRQKSSQGTFQLVVESYSPALASDQYVFGGFIIEAKTPNVGVFFEAVFNDMKRL